MYNNFIFLFLILIFISLTKSQDNSNDSNSEKNDHFFKTSEDVDRYFDNFKDTLKKYLIDNGYYKSERLIEPHEMKKILFELITEGNPDKYSDRLNNIFRQLAERFSESYYSKKKQVKGKDIFKLVNIYDIWDKFDDYLDSNKTKKVDDYFDDEDDDLDDKNSFLDDL